VVNDAAAGDREDELAVAAGHATAPRGRLGVRRPLTASGTGSGTTRAGYPVRGTASPGIGPDMGYRGLKRTDGTRRQVKQRRTEDMMVGPTNLARGAFREARGPRDARAVAAGSSARPASGCLGSPAAAEARSRRAARPGRDRRWARVRATAPQF
jgi:hypothetical protein